MHTKPQAVRNHSRLGCLGSQWIISTPTSGHRQVLSKRRLHFLLSHPAYLEVVSVQRPPYSQKHRSELDTGNKVRAAFAHRKPRSEKIWSATGSQQSSNKGDNVPESDCSCDPKSDRKTPLSKYPTPLRLGRETIALDLSP